MINRDAEDKQIGWQPENSTVHNSGITTGDCVPVMGVIKQGSTAQERQGDRIKPKRLTVRGTISIASNSFNTSQVLYARVIIAAQKTIKVGSQISAGQVSTGALLKPSFPTAPFGSFQGYTYDLDYPVNKELFKVYMDKIVKLTPVYIPANQGTCPNPTSTFRWSYTFKSLPANFQFDDINGDWVNNFAPFVAIGYAYCDGTSPDVLATKLVSQVYSCLSYEDS